MKLPARVALIDPMAAGHHVDYAEMLTAGLQQAGIKVILIGRHDFIAAVTGKVSPDETYTIEYEHGKGFTAELRKQRFLEKASRAVHDSASDLAHLLFLDRFIAALAVNTFKFHRIPLVGTLHLAYFSNRISHQGLNRGVRFVEKHLLRYLSRRGVRVQVHGVAVASAIQAEVREARLDVVPYPADPHVAPSDGSDVRRRLGVPDGAKLVLAFGATRWDKGADLAVSMLRYLPEDVHLLIAGRPSHFSESQLLRQANDIGTSGRLHLDLRFIPDSSVTDTFLAADCVILPYRKVFFGQSGPLTYAAALGIPVASAALPVLSETVEKFRLGVTFESENIAASADALLRLLTAPPSPLTKSFLQSHSREQFTAAVLKSYTSALQEP
jgi:glycosyltransferase involved in cell wall biosynthesis